MPLLLCAWLASAGPLIDMPPDEPARTDVQLRGLQNERLQTDGTVIGGYGQMNANALYAGPGANGEAFADPTLQASVRRLVVFLSHSFSFGLRAYSELEWENAIACATCKGSVEIEQAFVEWVLLRNESRDQFVLRGGLVLIPMGILNQWHEPPIFNGVDRSRLEEGALIPSTWRELGLGLTAQPLSGVRTEAYITTGLDPFELRDSGLSNARTNGSLTPAASIMASARVEVEPTLGAVVGVAGVAGDMGGRVLGQERFYDSAGNAIGLFLPLYGVDADARVRRWGVEARTVVGAFFLPASGDLMGAYRADGSRIFPSTAGAVPTRMLGASLELGYDVLFAAQRLVSFETEQQLVPFARVEYIDGNSDVPTGYVKNDRFRTKELIVGLTYRPILQVAVKVDGQLRNRGTGPDEGAINAGLGFMF